jgi:CheY-like chemotaxis protein
MPAALIPLPESATVPQVARNQRRILVVDDSAIIRKALSIKLKASGYEVLTAEDGSVAVSTARRERPDLILLDLSFPPDVAHGGGVAWDGFLIMGWLKRMEEAKDIPIIVITSGEAAQLKDRCMAAGAVGFFQKPINNEELLASIRLTLGSAGTPSQAPTAAQ